MSFFAILLALVLEQARPLKPVNAVYTAARRWVNWVARTFDAGVAHQAWITWGITVTGPALVTMLVHWLLGFGLGWFFAVAWNVALLYVTLGFRQFSHHFTAIRKPWKRVKKTKPVSFLPIGSRCRWDKFQAAKLCAT